jgi:hypothetical protein
MAAPGRACLRKVFAAQLAAAPAVWADAAADAADAFPEDVALPSINGARASGVQLQGMIVHGPPDGPARDTVYFLDDSTGAVRLQLAPGLFDEATGEPSRGAHAVHAKLRTWSFVTVWGPALAVQFPDAAGNAVMQWVVQINSASCICTPSHAAVAGAAAAAAASASTAAHKAHVFIDATTVWSLEIMHLWGAAAAAAAAHAPAAQPAAPGATARAPAAVARPASPEVG